MVLRACEEARAGWRGEQVNLSTGLARTWLALYLTLLKLSNWVRKLRIFLALLLVPGPPLIKALKMAPFREPSEASGGSDSSSISQREAVSLWLSSWRDLK